LPKSKTVTVLRKRSDFLRVSAKPIKSATKTMVVLAAPNDLSTIRVGYTVTKKTSKLAVERNRIKRRLRAIVQEILPIHAMPGYDYVIIGKLPILKRDYDELKGDLKYALKKLDIK
jgi:ribonuclease P protein component